VNCAPRPRQGHGRQHDDPAPDLRLAHGRCRLPVAVSRPSRPSRIARPPECRELEAGHICRRTGFLTVYSPAPGWLSRLLRAVREFVSRDRSGTCLMRVFVACRSKSAVSAKRLDGTLALASMRPSPLQQAQCVWRGGLTRCNQVAELVGIYSSPPDTMLRER
jgi:hypothetical protein